MKLSVHSPDELSPSSASPTTVRLPNWSALLNVLSVLSWIGVGDGYSATKAALWSATNAQRISLADQGTLVTALHLGYTDTPMTAGLDVPKNDPADIVQKAYDGVAAGVFEVLADDLSVQVKTGLAGPIEALYPPASASVSRELLMPSEEPPPSHEAGQIRRVAKESRHGSTHRQRPRFQSKTTATPTARLSFDISRVRAYDPLTDLQARHTLTDRAHRARPFMTEHRRRQHVPIGVAMDIGATDTGVRDVDDHPTGRRFNERLGALPEFSRTGDSNDGRSLVQHGSILLSTQPALNL